MNPEIFAQLARKSCSGDRRALTALLRLAHTPVSFQCRKLLRDDQAAEALTRQILAAVPHQLGSLSDPAEFEKWICRITASRCMQALSQMEREPAEQDSSTDDTLPEIKTTDLDETQTALLVQQLVDRLPEEPRICLLLYSCAGLKLKGISQLTGFPEPSVLEYLNQAQKTINLQLRKYHKMGVRFTPIPALSSLVRTAMYSSRGTKAAAVMVSGILPKKPAPVRKGFSGNKKLLLAAIAAGALLLVLLIVIVVLENKGI